jgi:Domain of unknown function (DUF4384)
MGAEQGPNPRPGLQKESTMRRAIGGLSALLVGLLIAPAPGYTRGLGIELWTDRGSDAVYQPGNVIQIKTRASDDAYLLVYEIDSEGYVHVLYPYRGSNGFIEGRSTYRVPPDNSGLELVVEKTTGQGYIVAIASREPFDNLPWYLRPYDPQAEGVGYSGREDEEDGVTADGQIVGDPFVQMERVRRRVIGSPNDNDAFATAYTTYYVHEQVRYPRYICYDCHRPNHWAWWDGFDPYYTSCSVFDFRVNWEWGWGPRYWYGSVPYFLYVPRPDCPPRYRYRTSYSSWDGWGRWQSLWGGHLTRYKTPPPQGYIPPDKYPRGIVGDPRWKDGKPTPPGFLVSDQARGRAGIRPGLPIGRGEGTRTDGASRGSGGVMRRGDPNDGPGRPRDDESGRGSGGVRVIRPGERPDRNPTDRPDVERPRDDRPRGEGPDVQRPREERPAPPPRVEKPRVEKPREEKPREEKQDRPAHPPRDSRPRDEKPSERPASPSHDSGGGRSSKNG